MQQVTPTVRVGFSARPAGNGVEQVRDILLSVWEKTSKNAETGVAICADSCDNACCGKAAMHLENSQKQ